MSFFKGSRRLQNPDSLSLATQNCLIYPPLSFGVVCWGSSISTADRKRLDRLIRRTSSVRGYHLDPVEVMGPVLGGWWRSCFLWWTTSPTPPQDTITALDSSFSDRRIHPRCLKERYHRSFLPAAVRPSENYRHHHYGLNFNISQLCNIHCAIFICLCNINGHVQ